MNPLVLLGLFRARAAQVVVSPQVLINGVAKLLTRFGVGTRATTAEAALILTPLEESILLTAGKDLLMVLGGVTYLCCIVGDTVRGLVSGDGGTRPPGERLGIIAAHIIKGSSALITAFASLEQAAFYVGGQVFGDSEDHIEFALQPFIDLSAVPRVEVDSGGPSEVFKSDRRW